MSPDEIKKAVEEAIDNKIGHLYIDRETHYEHHQFLKDMIEWMDDTKGTIRRAIVKAIVWGGLFLLILGFIVWGKGHFK